MFTQARCRPFQFGLDGRSKCVSALLEPLHRLERSRCAKPLQPFVKPRLVRRILRQKVANEDVFLSPLRRARSDVKLRILAMLPAIAFSCSPRRPFLRWPRRRTASRNKRQCQLRDADHLEGSARLHFLRSSIARISPVVLLTPSENEAQWRRNAKE